MCSETPRLRANFLIISHLDNILTDLEIIVGYYNESQQQNISENEIWIDMDGTSTLWLKCTYNQKSYGITKVNFYYFKYEKDLLVIYQNST